MIKRWSTNSLILLVGLVAPALAASSIDVVQNDRHFNVTAIKVTRGTLIRFLNHDEFIHHVEVDTANFSFDSGEQPPGQSVQISFTRSGIFDVHCAIHPKMHLIVEVQ